MPKRSRLLRCMMLFPAVLCFATLARAAPIDSVYDKSCTSSECHPTSHSRSGTISHPPFLEEWCDRCHTDHSGSGKNLLAAEPGELCLQCHAETEAGPHGVAHPPDSKSCTECHAPHESNVRHLLRDEAMLLQCSECHAEDLRLASEKPHKHQFFSPTQECGGCHYAHRAGEEGLYLRENLGETCLTCHDMTIMKTGRALENVGKEIRTAAHVHAPLKDDACHACHTPHGSVQPSLLKDNYPAGNYAAYDRANYSLCFSCHDATLVESQTTRDATGFRDGDMNLHSVHVLKSNRGRACHLCHTAHASERPHLLRETVVFNSWTSDFGYEETEEGGNCTTACHRPKEYSRAKH